MIKSVKNFTVKKSEFKDWESVFINPTSIKIETLKTGIIVSKISGIMNLNNINAHNLLNGGLCFKQNGSYRE